MQAWGRRGASIKNIADKGVLPTNIDFIYHYTFFENFVISKKMSIVDEVTISHQNMHDIIHSSNGSALVSEVL